jgi:hypothetical protein
MSAIEIFRVAPASGGWASASRRSHGRATRMALRLGMSETQSPPAPNFGGTPKFTRETRVLHHSALRAPRSAFHR